jgi:hypothetical protein
MGEILTDFSLEFNGSVKLEAREERLTSEAGAVLLREVDESTDLLLLGQGWRKAARTTATTGCACTTRWWPASRRRAPCWT